MGKISEKIFITRGRVYMLQGEGCSNRPNPDRRDLCHDIIHLHTQDTHNPLTLMYR